MINFLNKLFKKTNNLDYLSLKIKQLSRNTPVKKIFESINDYSSVSEVRYVGGCIRKIIQKEKVDDIDLATNLNPIQVCEALKKSNIKYYESGAKHEILQLIQFIQILREIYLILLMGKKI